MKKFILKLDLHDDKDKRKAMKTVSTLSGIDSITVDMKGQTLTVVGTVDPVSLATKLRKYWQANIISVGPAKEPEKKEEPKKEEPKKEEAKKEEEPKKEEAKKEEEPKKEEAPKEEPKKGEPKKEPEQIMIVPYNYRPYYPPTNASYYVHHSVEENPNACVIC